LLNFADYGVDKYDIGTGFGHFGIAVEDVSVLSLDGNMSFFFAFIFYASCT